MSSPPTGRPNVILILCDQLRWDAPGFSGGAAATPNLDYLASRGTRFDAAYTAVPSCIPARATLWSGQSQWHSGVLGMGQGQGPIPCDLAHTLPGELTAAGYQTRMVGKGHFWPQRARMGFEETDLDESGRTLINGFQDDYRRWFSRRAPRGVTPDDHGVNWNSWHSRVWHAEEYLHPTAWTMMRALEVLRDRDRSRPLFLSISFARPHSPYVPPDPYWNPDADMPQPARGSWADENERLGDLIDPNAWRGRMTDQQISRARSGYMGEVAFIDTQIGRLLNWMDRFARSELENTWFVFTSDHGDMLGDHNLWRKTYAYEGSAHIPLVVVPPADGYGRRTAAEPVELRDIMPTILSVAGLPIPETVDGASLLPLMEEAGDSSGRGHGGRLRWRDYIHGEHCTCCAPEQEMQYVTDGRRKLIWFPRTGAEQFFDLESDPLEETDLVDDPARKLEVDLWRDRLVRELDGRDCGWTRGGRPFCPGPDPLVSPYRDTRWLGD